MRTYASVMTAIVIGWLSIEIMLTWSHYDVIGIMFIAVILSYIAAAGFMLVTEPRKKKARWEKQENGLEVMIQGRRRNGHIR